MTVLFLYVFAAGFDMKRRVAGGVVGSLPGLTRDDVGAIPDRPIVLRRARFVRAVAQFCLPKKLRHRRDVEFHERTAHAFLLRSRLARKLIQHSNEDPARTVDECLLDLGVGSQADTKVSPIPSSDGIHSPVSDSICRGEQHMNRSARVRMSFISLAAALTISGGIVMAHVSMVAAPAGARAIQTLPPPFFYKRVP